MRCFTNTTPRIADPRPLALRCMASACITLLVGCGVPPSVDALMAQVGRAVTSERQRLDVDQQRAREALAERRATLRDAFEADLADRAARDGAGEGNDARDDEGERDWYRQHAEAYATAREAVLERAMRREAELTARQQNLADASAAQGRALDLIRAHRQLFQPLERRADGLRRWMTEGER